jgi:hypothetical protein
MEPRLGSLFLESKHLPIFNNNLGCVDSAGGDPLLEEDVPPMAHVLGESVYTQRYPPPHFSK